MLNTAELNEIAEMTLAQTLVKLVSLDVMPLTMHSTTVGIMEELVEFGYSGREIDEVKLHHCYFGDITGVANTKNHRKHLEGIVEKQGRNYSYLTSRGRVRGTAERTDYETAVKLQLLLETEKGLRG